MGTEPVDDVLVLRADLDHLSDARDWTRRHATGAGFDARVVGELELLITETLSNVIRHGYEGDASCEIELDAELLSDRLILRVVDRGPRFDPTRGEPVDLSEPKAGGYGLYLMETLTDELSWRRRDDGANEVTMTRLRPLPGSST